jgi:hypothetical protein
MKHDRSLFGTTESDGRLGSVGSILRANLDFERFAADERRLTPIRKRTPFLGKPAGEGRTGQIEQERSK